MATRLSFTTLCMIVTTTRIQDINSQLNSYSNTEINVAVGSTAFLPCTFRRSRESAVAYDVLWKKKGKGMESLVVHFQKGNVAFTNLAKRYVNRTSMDWDWMQLGNATLHLRNISAKDSGEYTCCVTSLLQSSSTVREQCQVILYVQSQVERESIIATYFISYTGTIGTLMVCSSIWIAASGNLASLQGQIQLIMCWSAYLLSLISILLFLDRCRSKRTVT